MQVYNYSSQLIRNVQVTNLYCIRTTYPVYAYNKLRDAG
jgi:hypothetical protein